jgi:hypothetical protein
VASQAATGSIAKAKAACVYKGRPPSIEASRVRELEDQLFFFEFER